jgi:hypothetical protein
MVSRFFRIRDTPWFPYPDRALPVLHAVVENEVRDGKLDSQVEAEWLHAE